MQILRTGLVMVGFPAYWQSAAIGLVIILALLIDQLRKQRQH
jgi:ribose transport system permease protein